MDLYRIVETAANRLARVMAWAGGLALFGVVVLVCVSIIGRGFGKLGFDAGPLPGDTELVEIGVGFAVFAFLPWCVLRRGHAVVDLFQPVFPRVANKLADLTGDLLILAAAVLIAWRMWLGMLDKQSYGETTWILQIPLWQAYAGAMTGAIAFALVSLFCVWRALRAFRT